MEKPPNPHKAEVDSLVREMEKTLHITGSHPATEDETKKIRELIKKLGSEQFTERESAGEALASIRNIAKDELRKESRNVDLEVRRRVYDLLAPFKIDRLTFGQSAALMKPLDRFAELGPAARDAAPLLIELLEAGAYDHVFAETPAVKYGAIKAIGKIGPDAGGAVTALIRLLDDPDLATKAATAKALGEIGPNAKAAVPALVGTFRQQSSSFWLLADRAIIKANVAVALGKINPPAGVVGAEQGMNGAPAHTPAKPPGVKVKGR